MKRPVFGGAMGLIVLIGVVSLFSDVTYEGARSINGLFLASLGAAGTTVGFVAGAGELLGYGLRVLSGMVSDRTRRYWTVTFIGYAVNLFAVPLLALAGDWVTASLLMVLERIGKAIRTPARDAILAHASAECGRGFAFAVHEALDQLGALTGPLIVAGVMALRGGYAGAYLTLLIPALMALAVLLSARFLYPAPAELEKAVLNEGAPKGFPRRYWIYLAAVSLVAAGFADFPLVAYHFKKRALVPETWVPVYYSAAMAVDAVAALAFGKAFDRRGISVLAAASILSAGVGPLVFSDSGALAFGGMVLWGIGMGAQESVLRAAVAELVPSDRRATAFGVFNAGYGLSWFLGSLAIGYLYDRSLGAAKAFCVVLPLLSVPIFSAFKRKEPRLS